MRTIAFFLAVLVLLLNGMPCADAADGKEQLLSPYAANGSHGQKDHSHQDHDLCSPFCTCACCATFTVISLPFVLPKLVESLAVPVYRPHVPGTTHTIPLPVWQPPQLV